MRYFTGPTILAISIILIGTASASEIYKWTDDEGNVHYTDKPVGNGVERVDIASKPTNKRYVISQNQARVARQAAVANAAAGEPSGPTPEELRASAKQRAERCDESRGRLTRYVQSRRLYKENDDGEREYLNDAEIDAARSKAEDQVAEYCNS